MINQAIIYATKSHEGQFRKGSNIAYILHPIEAGVIASEMKYDEQVIAAALLHDTVEDTPTSIEEIEKHFGKRVAALVAAQSEDKSKSWIERKTHTIEYLSGIEDEDIKIIALADKLSNMRAIDRDYKQIGDAIWERFNVKDKNLHGDYYKGLATALHCLSQHKAYQEFLSLVTGIFA